ncbi:hypothetical protein [Bradyrhizobium sp. SZCCHNR2026]|uniref:hypothetical protein n=1 Tax=Bradyrhizobium sp. SZCCHNR2026 TaxID=3057381 RepID=UPI00291704C5|nr:hypothetical protein [Bradyrhizobium sp. SZCCHNR2026]
MGILDFLTGNDQAASPWGALYPSPLLGPDPQQQAMRDAAAYGSMGLDPSSVLQPDPFGDPRKTSVINPNVSPKPATGFGAGAVPFAFAGPGSNLVQPSQITGAPVPQPAPAPAAPVAGPVPLPAPRPAAASAAPAADDGEDAPAAAAPGSGAPAPFSLGGAGLGDRLEKGARGFFGNMALGPVGAIMGGIGALATGKSTDPGTIQREQMNATGQVLLSKGASLADVQAAGGNPALMKALIDQYYGTGKYKVVQTGEDAQGGKSFHVLNEQDGTLRPVGAPASSAPAAVMGPGGRPIPIPAGVNVKEFVKRVTEASADAATGKKTEAQAKASSFAARMEQANSVMSGLQNEGLSPWGKAMDALPGGVGNYAQSKNYQSYKQAQSAFITALLRQESGAAVNKSEFDRYERELFPQPGDAPEVVQQKAEMRKSAIEQMRGAAGPGYTAPAPLSGGGGAPRASGKVNVGGQALNWSVN